MKLEVEEIPEKRQGKNFTSYKVCGKDGEVKRSDPRSTKGRIRVQLNFFCNPGNIRQTTPSLITVSAKHIREIELALCLGNAYNVKRKVEYIGPPITKVQTALI